MNERVAGNVPGGRSWGLAGVLTMAAVAVLATPWLASLVRPAGAWRIAAVEVVPVAGPGAPVMAFVDAACVACGDPLLQLRVCGPATADPGSCDVAARRPPNPGGITRLSYSRTLEPGRYRVEVLFLDRDAFGGHRSVRRHEAWVDVR